MKSVVISVGGALIPLLLGQFILTERIAANGDSSLVQGRLVVLSMVLCPVLIAALAYWSRRWLNNCFQRHSGFARMMKAMALSGIGMWLFFAANIVTSQPRFDCVCRAVSEW